jgi:hypothetical protein
VESDLSIWLAGARALVIFVAFSGFAWALWGMRRESAEQCERLTTEMQDARADIRVLCERVAALATLVAAIPARVEQRPAETSRAPRRDAPPVRSYESARRLARSGATVAEIVATCGVADSEARLLQRLHGLESQRETAA